MNSRILSGLVKAALVGAMSGVPMVASAAGFQLTEQSVAGLGRSFAGAAALSDDSSAIFYNPAGIVHLKREEFLAGASVIAVKADFDKTSATDAIGQPLSGGEGGDVFKLGGVPNAYYVKPLGEGWAWGIGFGAPFGLATDYERDSIFRYQAVYSYVEIVNIQPTMAWTVGENLSFGVGVDLQRMRVKLSNEIDFGAVCFGQAGPVTCTALGLTPQGADGAVTLEGDSLGYGWNAGVLLKVEGSSIGLSYRSKVEHDLEGDANFHDAPAIFTAQNVFTDTGIKADFTAPEMLSFSVAQEVNEDWRVSFDFSRTGWDTFQELRVRFDNPNQPDSVQPENWREVYKLALGVDWKYNDAWTFRAGIARDQSPVSTETRTARLPDGDRRWFSAGASWHMNDSWQFDAGYAYLQLAQGDSIDFDQTGATADRVVGTYKADASIFGFSARYFFD